MGNLTSKLRKGFTNLSDELLNEIVQKPEHNVEVKRSIERDLKRSYLRKREQIKETDDSTYVNSSKIP